MSIQVMIIKTSVAFITVNVSLQIVCMCSCMYVRCDHHLRLPAVSFIVWNVGNSSRPHVLLEVTNDIGQSNEWPWGHAVAQLVEALQAARSRVRFPMVSLEFFIDISFRPHCGLGVDSTSNINEYQEYFLGVKTAGA